jgi:hypothetical protein
MPRSFNASSTGYVECDCVLLCTFMQVPGVGEMRHGTEGWKCLETSMRTMVAILDGAGMTVMLFLCVCVCACVCICLCVYVCVCMCVCVCACGTNGGHQRQASLLVGQLPLSILLCVQKRCCLCFRLLNNVRIVFGDKRVHVYSGRCPGILVVRGQAGLFRG